MSNRIIGKTKWFSSKGEAYGFIDSFLHEDGKPGQVYVHYKSILEDNQENPKFRLLPKGRMVEFEIGTGYPSEKAGTQALNVKLLPE